MTDLGALIAKAAGEGGVLSLLYTDLAQPGVRQVGAALGTVLQLGNSILLPLRLLNETTRRFEERKFKEIADRFEKIPIEEVIEVAPEIGVPILESLSYTDDKSLRTMFIELLAKSASDSQVDEAHPSFVNVIASLSPDEAILLRHLQSSMYIPFISVDAKKMDGSGKTNIYDLIIIPPSGIAYPENVPLYLSNLSGLGLIELMRETYLTGDGAYDILIDYCKKSREIPDVYFINGEQRSIDFKRSALTVLPYGRSFLKACT